MLVVEQDLNDAHHSQLLDTTNLEGKQSRITMKLSRIKVGLIPMTRNRTVGSEGLHGPGRRSLF